MNTAQSTNIIQFPVSANPGQRATMSSREIAERTGKRHDNVIADIVKMFDQMGESNRLLGFQEWLSVETGSKTVRNFLIYNLPKRETLILVSGYSVVLRAKIIDRWEELESGATKPAQTMLTRSQQIAYALLAANEEIQELTGKVQEREYQLLEQTPKVEFYDLAMANGESMRLSAASKLTVCTPPEFNRFLRENGFLYKRQKGRGNQEPVIAIQRYIDFGWFEWRGTPSVRIVNYTTWITPKGLRGLWERFGSELFSPHGAAELRTITKFGS
jgi:phage regulator Rha-like protein